MADEMKDLAAVHGMMWIVGADNPIVRERMQQADEREILVTRGKPEDITAIVGSLWEIAQHAVGLSEMDVNVYHRGMLYGFQLGHDYVAKFGEVLSESPED